MGPNGSKQIMKSSRCGNKEKVTIFVYVKGGGKQELTLRIENTRLSNKEVDQAIERAFAKWQEVSGLNFRRKMS